MAAEKVTIEMHRVTIGWGEAYDPEKDDDENFIATYSFKTPAERTAFLAGVDAAIGWMGYTIVPTKEG